jgi:hypothetical protein
VNMKKAITKVYAKTVIWSIANATNKLISMV